MQSVEAEAKTRQEAIQKALDELGVEMHDVEDITILDEGSKGFLGMGTRPVRVRVSVDRPEPRQRGGRQRENRERGEQPARNEQPRGERQRGRGGERNRSDKRRDEAPREEKRAPKEEMKPRRDTKARPFRGEEEAPGRGKVAAAAGAPQKPRSDDAEPAGEGEDRKPLRRRARAVRRPRRGVPTQKSANGSNGSPREEQEQREERPAREPRGERRERPERPRREDVAPAQEAEVEARSRKDDIDVAPITDEQGREAAAMLQEIISKMGLEATVEYARAEDGAARLNISSEDSALLIGRKGRNLQAMQYLINRVISRSDANDVTERLIVDIEGYVDRRKAALEELAENMAARAKSAGRDMRLKPMSPQERRIVHLALQNDEEVRTFSLGDSLFRTVVISPRDRRGGGGGGRDRDNRRGGRGGARRGGRGRGRGRSPRGENAAQGGGEAAESRPRRDDAPSESSVTNEASE